jgi:hypothetical protein
MPWVDGLFAHAKLRRVKYLLLLAALSLSLRLTAAEARLNDVRKIWDAAPHNAFTDLVRWKERWWCAFREGATHVSKDGALRVIVSEDARQWRSAALVTNAPGDLRDAKLAITPDGRLMLSGASALPPGNTARYQSLAWFSRDGENWGEPVSIGEPNVWLWRTTWHKGAAYGVGYGTTTNRFARLYRSADGRRFETLVPQLFAAGYPNEATLLFNHDDTALCLLRRDGKEPSGQLGLARPPYTDWKWKDLGVKIGGPNFIRIPDGRLVAAVRLYDKRERTSLAWLDVEQGKLTEFLALPSGGDCSYAGLAWHEGKLWVSYYSSHEGRTAIYLANVTVTSTAR